jgi:hypothetical protein
VEARVQGVLRHGLGDRLRGRAATPARAGRAPARRLRVVRVPQRPGPRGRGGARGRGAAARRHGGGWGSTGLGGRCALVSSAVSHPRLGFVRPLRHSGLQTR